MRTVQSRKSGASPIEQALRYLGTRNHGALVDLLEHGIDRPQSGTGLVLAPLTESTRVLGDWTPSERARALWRVIEEGVHSAEVGPTSLSRRRRALVAALRLSDPDIGEPWSSSLSQRFRQLKRLEAVFGNPTTTQPMEMAWARGVRALAKHVEDRLRELENREDWNAYAPRARMPQRPPSRRADPIFVDYMVTTVFLKGRAFSSRITERLITSMADGVDRYVMRGRPPLQGGDPGVQLGRVWGCRAEPVPFVPHGEVIANLLFARLAEGQQHWFASELLSSGTVDERPWVNVPVNNHGIAAGELTLDGIPTRGLTVRVVFDPMSHPADVWYYTDPDERTVVPAKGNERRLRIRNGLVSHTFLDPCEPRDQVGVAFSWE